MELQKAIQKKLKHITAMFIVIYLTISVQAQQKCQYLFNKTNSYPLAKASLTEKTVHNLQLFMSRFKPQQISDGMAQSLYFSIKKLLADTTGKRIENKVTAKTEDVQKSISNFQTDLKKIGLDIIDRDKQITGKMNVTYTEYTKPFSLTVDQLVKFGFTVRPDLLKNPNHRITVKIRIRSYGTVDQSKENFGLEDIEFAPFTKNRAFVELKFADPSYDGAVFKPQMYFNKDYLKLFGHSAFLQRFKEIKDETLSHLKISDKKSLDSTSVEAMLEFIKLAHEENLDLKIVAINIYNRVAKSVQIKYDAELDPDFDKSFGSIKSAELQMTFDKMIALFIPGNSQHLGEKKYYHAYGPDQTVAEFKTPTYLAHHLKRAEQAATQAGRKGLLLTLDHESEIEKIAPGLKEYILMIDSVIQKRDEMKELNRGKWGVAVKQVHQDMFQFLKNFFKEDAVAN